MHAYDNIMNNEVFMKIIAYTLAIGNIINGGNAQKGQSDGFEMAVLGKLTTTKDNNNKTMMQYILQKMYAEDPDLHQKVKDLYKSVNIKEVDTKYIKTKTSDLGGMYNKRRADFNKILEDDRDEFIEEFESVLDNAKKE